MLEPCTVGMSITDKAVNYHHRLSLEENVYIRRAVEVFNPYQPNRPDHTRS